MPAVTMLTLLLLLADMAVGSTSIPLKELWRSLTGNGSDESIRYIILNFRIPKAVTALLSGAALSAVGLQMQTLFRNPLAGPYVLGVSSGASLGVALFTLGMPLLGISASSVWWGGIGAVGAAWAGAALILLVIMAVTTRIKDIMAVLIMGMMFGSAATAIVEILQYMSPEGAVKSYVVWTMGSLGGCCSPNCGYSSPSSPRDSPSPYRLSSRSTCFCWARTTPARWGSTSGPRGSASSHRPSSWPEQ